MFSAKRLLGSMVGSGLRRATGGLVGGDSQGGSGGLFGTSTTGLAAGAVGVAAAGGLAYAAYRHFQGGGAPGGGLQGPGAGAGGGMGGMLGGLVGTTGGLQSGSPGAGGASATGFDPYAHQARPSPGPSAPAGWARPEGAASQTLPTWEAPQAGPQAVFPPGSSATSYGAPEAASGTAMPAELTKEDATAMLLVRAMIAAANVDGRIDQTERVQILNRVSNAGLEDADRLALESELDNPMPLRQLLGAVDGPETARQFYMVSLLAISADTDEERSYLQTLPTLLGLSADTANGVRQLLGM